jgi:diguanylate cyclase (GGDEF)-like protein/PAS domain S-box-containing protein
MSYSGAPYSRIVAAGLLVLGCLLFQFGPDVLQLDSGERHWWSVIAWIVVPAAAAVACFRAHRVASGYDRRAWLELCLGSGLWSLGTVAWQFHDLRRFPSQFPGVADAAYVLTCVLFIFGIYHFGVDKRLITRVQIANLVLTLLASTLSGFLLLLPVLDGSQLSPLGTLVAFFYPVAWFGTGAFGLICLVIHSPRHKQLVLGLVLLAVFAQALANLQYGVTLMGSGYDVGGLFDSAWVMCFLFVAWAAVEDLRQSRLRREAPEQQLSRFQLIAEAFVPAACVAAVFTAAIAVGLPIHGWIYLSALPATATFMVLFGVREHWMLQAERKLRAEAIASSRELSAVLDSTSDSVTVIDRDWRITYLNRRAHEVLGDIQGFAVGAKLWDAFPDAMGTQFQHQYEQAFATGKAVEFEEFLAIKGVWLQVHAYPSDAGLSIFFRDVTERRQAHAKLEHLARHDSLTGLHNRRAFRERLSAELANAGWERGVAVLCLDLDHFKEVNDTLGHAAGDALLVEVAQRIQSCTGKGDYVARIGGDEFAIISVGRSGRAELEGLADRLVTALGENLLLEEAYLRVGVSIGMAVAGEAGNDGDHLLQRADIALYEAKRAGRGTYRLFELEMEARMVDRQAIKADLESSLAKSEFELFFQPVVDLAKDRVDAFEALLRWRHSERGLVSPADFIPVAEETGLILPIGAWALRRACRAAMAWPEHVNVAVNLSACEFRNNKLLQQVSRALADSGLPAHRLELEITESVLMQESELNLHILHQLRNLGVGIALDDFGTGFSSLSYLRKFPFTKLKIDRSFVVHVDDEGESQAIIKAITTLGRTLGMTITAEGVETRQQLDRIRANGSDFAQGYFFSKPVPESEARKLVGKIDADKIWWGAAEARSAL